MDRIWQWAWERHGARYTCAICAVLVPVLLQIYLVFSFCVVDFEDSGHYVEAAAVTVLAVLGVGLGRIRLTEQWAAGQEVDRVRALEATYSWARGRLFERWGPTLWGPRCCWWLSV
jgi:adenylate cyclase